MIVGQGTCLLAVTLQGYLNVHVLAWTVVLHGPLKDSQYRQTISNYRCVAALFDVCSFAAQSYRLKLRVCCAPHYLFVYMYTRTQC